MAKFASIWGDLSVGSVTPAEGGDAGEEAKKAADEAAAKEAANAGEEEEEEEEDIEKGLENPKTPPEEEEEEEGIEFSEEDVSKAFTMLEDEGVLDLGEDDEFDASVTGLGDAVAATVRNKLAAEIAKIPPEVQQFYSHVMAGNDPEAFKIEKALKWEDVDDSDEEIQEKALRQLYINQGMTQEQVEEEIEDAKTNGKLEKKASAAITVLSKAQKDDEAAKAKAKEKAADEAEKERVKEIKALESTIDSTEEIAGFKLDDKKRKGFKDYLFKVNPRTGKTQMQENMASEDRKLQIAFLDFVNYTKADLSKEEASKLTTARKKKLSRYTDKSVKNKNNSATVKTKTDGNRGKIKFPSIFGNQTIEVED